MKDDFDLVSIIMAAYNSEKTILQSVESVIRQTYQNWELIIVDDCSTDNTFDCIQKLSKKDKRIRVIQNKMNKGVSYTRKHGLLESKGKWIAILDSDDIWVKDKLEKQILIQREKNADLIYTGSGFIDTYGHLLNWNLHVPSELSYNKLLKQNLISNSSALVRKQLYSTFYAEGDNMHEDFALWLSILKTGIIAYGIDEPLLIYRLDKHSKSGNKIKAAKMNWKTYRYVGLNIFKSIYYELCYIINGLLKYKNLK